MITTNNPPPHNKKAEMQVLCKILSSKKDFYNIISELEPKHFYITKLSMLYSIIKKYKTIDLAEIMMHSSGTDLSDVVSDIMTDNVDIVSGNDVSDSITRLKELRSRREAVMVATKYLSGLYDDFDANVEELTNDVQAKLYKCVDNNEKSMPERIGAIVPKVFEKMGKQQSAGGDGVVKTGLKEVDESLFIDNGDFIIFAARPSMGKSSLASQIARYNAIKLRKSVGYFTIEMKKTLETQRAMFSEAKVSLYLFNKGVLPRRDYAKIPISIGPLVESNIYIDDSTGLSPMMLRSKLNYIKAEAGLDLVIIDYIQLSKSDEKHQSRHAELGSIAYAYRDIAKEYNVPVIALSQLNRTLELRPNKRPILSDLRESGTMEEAACTVGFIYRDEVYNKDTEDKGIAEIIIAKQRNGPPGYTKVCFDKDTFNFRNYVKETPEYYQNNF